MADDKSPHGSLRAEHWPSPIPESMWCVPCDVRQKVTGRFSRIDGSLLGVRLACGHRMDLPFEQPLPSEE